MERSQKIFQKTILFFALVITAATFFYSLGFATNLYSLNYHSDPGSSLLYVKGAELYHQIQPFNKVLLRDAAVNLVLCITMFVTLSHRRRLYYITNYVACMAFSGFAVYLGATNLVNALYIKQQYLRVDFKRMKEITDMLNLRYVESTFMLDLGTVLSVLLFLASTAIIINLIWKSVNMQKEKRLRKETI